MYNSRYYRVYSQRMFEYLQRKGFKLVGAQAQKEDTSKIIYIFDDSPEIREAVEDYVMMNEILKKTNRFD